MSRFVAALALALLVVAGCQQSSTTSSSTSSTSTSASTATTPPSGETAKAPAAGEPQASAAPTRTTPSGLQIQELKEGSGAMAEPGKKVWINYTGWLTDGTKFDSSEGGKPYELTLGAREVIAGWDEGIVGMKIGGKRRLTIPPQLAYGPQGIPGGPIPPNATLVFDLELMDVK